MDEDVGSGSSVTDSFYPVFVGASFALNALSELEKFNSNCQEERKKALKGAAHLFGAFLWGVQNIRKLENAQRRIEELITQRNEESKSWLNEREMLRQQIVLLMDELRIVEAESEKYASQLRQRLEESELLVLEKDSLIEEIEERKREMEEKANAAEIAADDLREIAKHEAECHSTKILKHKTAIIELVSAQRHLQAELNRAERRIEAAKEEFDPQKEQAMVMNQRLSAELMKLRKELEQKDQVLSTVLRKSEAEKQLLLKVFKPINSMRKREKPETEKWKESKHEKHLYENLMFKQMDGYGQPHVRNGLEMLSLVSEPYLIAEADVHVDLESKMEELLKYVHGVEQDYAELRQENRKLEAQILDQKRELHSLKEQLLSQNSPDSRKLEFSNKEAINRSIICYVEKAINTSPEDGMQELKEEKYHVDDKLSDIVLAIEYPEKEAIIDAASEASHHSIVISNDATKKIDLQALRVTYKIKRLKQQLLVLERLKRKQERVNNESESFAMLISLLNKQVDRYQSLQEKTDDLCRRMLDSNLNLSRESSSIGITRDDAKILEHFLGETFQLQRFIVATGQKLTQVQAKIVLLAEGEEGQFKKVESFDVKRFADTMRTLFREVQMGLEIRMSRIIGDLEGTLACNGIIQLV